MKGIQNQGTVYKSTESPHFQQQETYNEQKKREKKEMTKHFSSVLGQIPPFCSNTALTQALHSPPSIALCIVPLIICLLASWLPQYVATFCFQFECLISLRVDELNCCSGRWGCCLISVFLGNETPCRNVLFHNCYNKCTGWNCSEIGKGGNIILYFYLRHIL